MIFFFFFALTNRLTSFMLAARVRCAAPVRSIARPLTALSTPRTQRCPALAAPLPPARLIATRASVAPTIPRASTLQRSLALCEIPKQQHAAPRFSHQRHLQPPFALPRRPPSRSDWSYQPRAYVRRTWGWDQLGEDAIAKLLILLNVIVALMWWIFGQTREGRQWMTNHFTVSLRNVRQGRVWTIITSAWLLSEDYGQANHTIFFFFVPQKATTPRCSPCISSQTALASTCVHPQQMGV